MKQPQLGRLISELRHKKGITQEELVDRCNISVRTIQRIEAGEVTPRSFTLKTILNALEYDMEMSKNGGKTGIPYAIDFGSPNKVRSLLLHLKFSWIAGAVYFILGFLEFAIDWSRLYNDSYPLGFSGYIAVKCIALTSYAYFMIGFVLLAKHLRHYLLAISAYILIFLGILFYGYDILSLYRDPFDIEYVLVSQSLLYGAGSFLFGFALLKTHSELGNLSYIAGGFTIASSVMFLMVFMAWLGYFFLIPATLAQIVLLYKFSDSIKMWQTETP